MQFNIKNTDAFKSTSYFTACVNLAVITVQNALFHLQIFYQGSKTMHVKVP